MRNEGERGQEDFYWKKHTWFFMLFVTKNQNDDSVLKTMSFCTLKNHDKLCLFITKEAAVDAPRHT